MSDDTYQIETRRRSRSKTPFLRSAGEEGHVQQPKKKSAVPSVQ